MKHAASTFLELVATGHVREATDRFVGKSFVHHNPFFAAGAEALVAAMEENAKRHPHMTLTVERAIGEGEYVAVHSRIKPAPDMPTMAAVHIFRFEGVRVVELWDVVQPLPDDSPNADGMF